MGRTRRRAGRGTVLALRAAGLGDLLTAAPALRALSHAVPGNDCVVAAPQWLAPALDAVDAPLRLLPHRGTAPVEIDAPPELAVNLHGSGPESHRALLAARPARVLAFAHDDVSESRDGPTWIPGEHEVHRWCRLLEWFGIPADPTAPVMRRPARPPVGYEGRTVLHPGAAHTARRWPEERWAELAARLVDDGHAVLVTGAPDEAGSVARVVEAANDLAGIRDVDRLRGATTLPLGQLLAVVAASRLVCSGDTGVAHAAFAYGTPSVTLYGPVSPARWGPWPGLSEHVALWAGTEGDPHAFVPDPGLLRIGVAEVHEAIGPLETGGRDRCAPVPAEKGTR